MNESAFPIDHQPSTMLFPNSVHQPRHVLAEGGHRPQAFLFGLHRAGLAPDADVPVRRAGNDHLLDEEEMVDRIESVNRARPSDRHNRRADLAPKHPAVRHGDQG